MKTIKQIKDKIDELSDDYRELRMKYHNDDSGLLTNGIADQVRILKWVLEE